MIRAALDLFTTRGFHDSTTPEIAKKAGIAEGTIYRHFPSKTSLLNELYRGATELFTSVLVDSANLPTCRERMSRIAQRWREIAGRDPALAKLVFVSPPTGLFDARSREFQARFRSEVEKVLASGKASGEIRAGSVSVWADVWLQLIILTLDRIAKGDWEPDHPAVRQVAESAWDAIAAPTSHD